MSEIEDVKNAIQRIENELIPMCQKHGIGLITWAPMAMGVLAGRYKKYDDFPESSRASLRGGFYADRVTQKGIEIGKKFSKIAEKNDLTAAQLNDKLHSLMKEGYGSVVVKNPQGKHSLGVGILNKLNLIFEGSLGYFGVGSIDGPIVRITGRVGWSCAENMMAGKVVVEKNAGSCFGAAIRGGDLISKGSVGARTGIDMKGGTIMIGGDAGAFTGFMMQRGRIIILGNTGPNLGDSMYDGTIFVGGTIKSLGSDAIKSKLTPLDIAWLKRKLKVAEIGSNFDVSKMTKIVAGKKLWNYDQLEPTEKKGAI